MQHKPSKPYPDWIVANISLVVQQLSAEGYKINRELLASLIPYLTSHIKRYGDYVVDWKNVPQPWEQAIPLSLVMAEIQN
ncbi:MULTISPECIES: Tn3 family transposase [unclassified Microcoleus]|uniref:Tn3 family transposase n=1 Tax=unclassified Microcoleus TaxID=2642155 RepID=UPI002FD2BA34